MLNMESLLECIKHIEELAETCDREPCQMTPFAPEFADANRDIAMKLVAKFMKTANDLLVDVNGVPNHDNICRVQSAGYDVICLEKDKYGWLLGGVVTRKGVIAFG